MPNPFPGMDPYLEGDLWTSVHTDLCVQIAHQLSPKLRPKYFALSTRRVVVAARDTNGGAAKGRYPDVGILTSHPPSPAAASAVATVPLVRPVRLPELIPHVSVEIRDVAQRRLVTCIEVLSPTNKAGSGQEEYNNKRYQVLSGSAHLVEIDLLRAGDRFPAEAPIPDVPYFVFVSRAESRHSVDIWPIPLEQPLPTVPIPLLPEDLPVMLDLQEALRIEYDIIGYDELIDYSQPPPGPLTPEQATWIDERLRHAGRRTTP